jgi:DNA polymerase-1
MRTILIDGDVALYSVTKSCEYEQDWGNDFWTLATDMKEARHRLDLWIGTLKTNLTADSIIIALSGDENWRKDVYPKYKLHRKKHRKPMGFVPLKEYMNKVYRCITYHNLEGDDVLGMLATCPEDKYTGLKGDRIVVSIDKDLKTIPGFHYNPDKPQDEIYMVDPEQADYNHLFQTLTGDAVDGYPGCPGIGPKRAERLLEDSVSWDTVVGAYENAGLTAEDALVQARVARILRWGDYKRKEVILWEPQ